MKPAPPILEEAATAAWLRYVDAVVAQAKDRVTHWERVIAQGQFAGVGEHDDAYLSIPLTAAYRTAAGAALVAYWLPWQPQEYTPRPARITLRLPATLAFREPVLVNLLDGSVHALPAPRREGVETVFADLPMFDFPLVVGERSEIAVRAERSAPVYDTTPGF